MQLLLKKAEERILALEAEAQGHEKQAAEQQARELRLMEDANTLRRAVQVQSMRCSSSDL